MKSIRISLLLVLVSLCSNLLAKTVGHLNIEGNSLTSERFIRKNIRTREGMEFHETILNEDLRRLYALGRFDKVSFQRNEKDDLIDITIVVEEKPIVDKIVFEGNKRLKDNELLEKVRILEQERYDRGMARRDADELVQLYIDRGFLTAQAKHEVRPVKDIRDRVELVFRITEGLRALVGGIEFVGAPHVSRYDLSRVMETKVDGLFSSAYYDPGKFRGDLERLEAYLRSIGYLDAKVKPGKSRFSENGKWLYLQIEIEEGRLYLIDKITIKGNEVYSVEEILHEIPVKVGMPYSEQNKSRLEYMIGRMYGRVGRIFTHVNATPTLNMNKAHVQLDVEVSESEEVFVENVFIRGNDKTRDVVIRRELLLFPLERANTDLIERSERNLLNLGFFKTVRITPEVGSQRHLANIRIVVEEQPTGNFNVAFGFSSIESFFLMFKYRQKNFDWRDRRGGLIALLLGQGYVGDGQELILEVNTGVKTRKYQLDFQEPWVFNRKVHLGYGFFHTESEVANYDEKRDGVKVRVGREFIPDLGGYLTMNYQRIEISDIDNSVSPAIKDEEGINDVVSLINEWVYESRDNRFRPTMGWNHRAGLALAGGPFGGDKDFYKLTYNAITHKKVFTMENGGNHVLNWKLSTGYAHAYGDTEKVPIYERFSCGGYRTVRGFPYRSLGPRDERDPSFEIGGELLLAFTGEYEFPVTEDVIRGVFFYDQGYSWNGLDDFNYNDTRSSAGFGMRISVPALGQVPIMLDFAFPVRKKHGDETETFTLNFGGFF